MAAPPHPGTKEAGIGGSTPSYCWAFINKVRGMTEDTARRAIDWLHDRGCRVLALMGGEPLLRPQFAQKVVYYAILLMANPTWINTQSPATGGLCCKNPRSTLRRTPTTSTIAVLGWSGEMSTILPGIARHIQVLVCNSESTNR